MCRLIISVLASLAFLVIVSAANTPLAFAAAGESQPGARAVIPPAATPNTPSVSVNRVTPVAVDHEGEDSTGAKLAFQLKSAYNSSSLFELTEKDTPKIRVYLLTAPEFPGRPNLASAYAVVWAFSQSESTLSFLLAREVGVVANTDVEGLVARIAAQTDGLAVKYSYLFNK